MCVFLIRFFAFLKFNPFFFTLLERRFSPLNRKQSTETKAEKVSGGVEQAVGKKTYVVMMQFTKFSDHLIIRLPSSRQRSAARFKIKFNQNWGKLNVFFSMMLMMASRARSWSEGDDVHLEHGSSASSICLKCLTRFSFRRFQMSCSRLLQQIG